MTTHRNVSFPAATRLLGPNPRKAFVLTNSGKKKIKVCRVCFESMGYNNAARFDRSLDAPTHSFRYDVIDNYHDNKPQDPLEQYES